MNSIVAEKYGWNSQGIEQNHSYLLPPTLKLLRNYKIKNLLDIGTGNGALLPFWKSLNLDVSAIEPDEEGYKYACQQTTADVRMLGVGDSLPENWKNSFDAIVCLEVVEHLFDPELLIKTINFTLKTSGIVIISTPYHGYFKNLMLSVANKWDFHHHPLRVGGHIKFWSRNTLLKLFPDNQYHLIAFHGVGRFPYLWKSMILVFKKNEEPHLF